MTIEQDKLNAVFLSALMVLSVMVGSIAFVGSAAATSGLSIDSATPVQSGETIDVSANATTAGNNVTFEVTDSAGTTIDTSTVASDGTSGNAVTSLNLSGAAEGTATVTSTDDASGDSQSVTFEIDNSGSSVASAVEYNGGTIEVAFDDDIQTVSSATVYVGDSSGSSATNLGTNAGGAATFTAPSDYTPNQDVTVDVTATDAAGNQFTVTDVSVTATSTTFDSTSDANTGSGTYEGSTVAYTTNVAGTGILVERGSVGDASSFTHEFSGSTAENSMVFVYDTEGKTSGTDYRITEGTESGTTSDEGSFALRSFDLSIDAPSTAVKEDDINIDLSANDGNRDLEVNLLDNNGKSADSASPTLSGSGSASISLSATETGNYTAEVVDVNTGVTATTDTITVEEAGETVVNFAGTSNDNERGDVIEIALNMQNTQNGHVKIGSESAHYRVYGNITDGNNDGTVTLLLNTYNASAENDYGISVANSDDDFTADESDNVPDNLGVVKPLDTGTYDLEAGLENVEDSATGLSTFTVGSRSTDSATTFIGSSSTDFEGQESIDSLSQSETVALQDKVIVSVKASGIYGLLQEYQNEDGSYTLTSGEDQNLSLDVTQTNPGRNSDGADIPEEDIEVVPDAENDTLYFVMDTNSIEEFDVSQESDPKFNVTFTVGNPNGNALVEEEQSVSSEFSVTDRTASINTNAENVVEVSADSSATISGTSSLAPGSSVSVEIRFDNNEFIQTNQATVDENGEWSTEYDLSNTEAGNTFQVQVRGLSDQLDGEVVDSVSTTTEPGTTETVESTTEPTTTSQSTTEPPQTSESTDTPEDPGTESDGGVPGFGLSAALIALIGAALIALRRD